MTFPLAPPSDQTRIYHHEARRTDQSSGCCFFILHITDPRLLFCLGLLSFKPIKQTELRVEIREADAGSWRVNDSCGEGFRAVFRPWWSEGNEELLLQTKKKKDKTQRTHNTADHRGRTVKKRLVNVCFWAATRAAEASINPTWNSVKLNKSYNDVCHCSLLWNVCLQGANSSSGWFLSL